MWGGRSEIHLFKACVALSAWGPLALAVAVRPLCCLVAVHVVIRVFDVYFICFKCIQVWGERSEMHLFKAHLALTAWDALALAVAIRPLRCPVVVHGVL